MLTVPEFQSKEAISKRLGISASVSAEILTFLTSIGLAKQHHGRFITGESQIFLGSDSPLISKHHINWRLQAIRAVEKDRAADDLHYSSVWSISERDFLKIKAQLVKYLDETRTVLKESKEEDVVCLSLDFFKLKT